MKSGNYVKANRIYKEVQQITLAVDCIIFGFNDNKLELLLIKRGFEPEKGKWSLIGGFVGNDEDVDCAAERVLRDLSGLKDLYLEQVKVFGKMDRESQERVVSIAYYALILKDNYNDDLVREYNAKWFPIDELPPLIFDHQDMIESSVHRLRKQVKSSLAIFNLLQEKFTLPQLQKLYEVILDENLDKRNFRKKIKELDFLKKLDEKDKSESKKGAFFYQLDESKYSKIQNFSL